MAYVLTAIIFFIVIVIVVGGQQGKKAEAERVVELRQYLEFDEFNNHIKIKKRSSALKGEFFVNENRNNYLTYTPDKLVYTGATVGGVTMGGTHVEKGGYSVHTGSVNGTYSLVYRHGKEEWRNYEKTWSPSMCASIELKDEDFAYMKKNFPKIRVATKKHNIFFLNKTNTLLLLGCPREDLEKIITWLCSDE